MPELGTRDALKVSYNAIEPYADELEYTEGPTRSMSNAFTWDEALERLKTRLGLTGDCVSLGVTPVFKWAGLADPNGLGYDGYGYTGTLMDHLPKIVDPITGIHAGSIGVYGEYPGVHAIVALEPYRGSDTRINSHGLAYAWQSTLGPEGGNHVGQPLQWYAIEGLLPEAPKSYHYERFDPAELKLPVGTNSERGVVENYDKYRKNPVMYAIQLRREHKNLIFLHQLAVNEFKATKVANDRYLAWREQQLALRVANKVVKPS